MKMLLAGPGTGKTTKIKKIIKEEYPDAVVQVLSFTNATVNDLSENFKQYENVNVSTLHSYALKLNHLPNCHILDELETQIIKDYSKKLNIDFIALCNLLNCLTYNMMITSSLSFLTNNKVYALEKIGQLDLLIVDEYQDFNETERDLISLISEFSSETFILGDDDQSIYGFKDADPDGIINLFNSEIEKIEHENICYRCPDEVVKYCSKLLSKNQNRIVKEWKQNNNEGKVFFKQTLTQLEADDYIFDAVNKILDKNDGSSILILTPVGFAVSSLISRFESDNIPFVNFWNTKIPIDLMTKIWILKAIFLPNKILNLIFISKYLNSYSKNKFIKLLKEHIHKDLYSQELLLEILKINEFTAQLYSNLINQPDLSEFMEQNPDFQIFSEFIDSTDIIKSINSLQQQISPKVEFQTGGVNVMSIHKSKGLQAEYVFITGMVDGIIPNISQYGLDTIEAQRRLLFVGMSRAIKVLCLVSVVEWEGKLVNKVEKSKFKYDYRKRKWKGRFSSFVDEMRS